MSKLLISLLLAVAVLAGCTTENKTEKTATRNVTINLNGRTPTEAEYKAEMKQFFDFYSTKMKYYMDSYSSDKNEDEKLIIHQTSDDYQAIQKDADASHTIAYSLQQETPPDKYKEQHQTTIKMFNSLGDGIEAYAKYVVLREVGTSSKAKESYKQIDDAWNESAKARLAISGYINEITK